MADKEKKEVSKEADLKASMDRLSASMNSLVDILKNAEKGIKTEASMEDKTVSEKIDILVSHNEEIARALLLLLELNREHLPKISRQTRITSDSSERQKTMPRQMARQQMPPSMQPYSPRMSIPEIELPPLDIEPPPSAAKIEKKKFFGFGK